LLWSKFCITFLIILAKNYNYISEFVKTYAQSTVSPVSPDMVYTDRPILMLEIIIPVNELWLATVNCSMC